MPSTHDDRRADGRRQKARRMYDVLDGVNAPEEVKQLFDKLLWSKLVDADRRSQSRRSGEDRRDEAEADQLKK